MFKWLRMSQFCFGIWWKNFLRFRVVTVSQSNHRSCYFVALVVLFRSAVITDLTIGFFIVVILFHLVKVLFDQLQ